MSDAKRNVLAAAVIGLFMLGLVVLSYLGLQQRPLTPQLVLRTALSDYYQGSYDLFTPHRTSAVQRRLRGLSQHEAQALVAACGDIAAWTVLGKEEQSAVDCAPFTLLECKQTNGALIARLWMDRKAVDHVADLVVGSDFIACRTGQCPDFALGEPRTDGVLSCETPFKIQDPVTKP